MPKRPILVTPVAVAALAAAIAVGTPSRSACAAETAEAAEATGGTEATPAKGKAPGPGTASAPAPPNVTLRIAAPTPRGAWTMQVTNEGDVPVTLAADARLLMLDVTPRSAKKAVHCELPAGMRPGGDLDRPLVLPPHRSYSEKFQPRLYCIEGNKPDALAPGAIVVAQLGWSGRGIAAPVVVSPIDGVEPKVSPAKALTSEPIALPDEDTPTALPSPIAGRPTAAAGQLTLTAVPVVDAESPTDIAIPITLRNNGSRAVVVRFRPETLSFEVIGPRGTDHCGWPTSPGAPTREAFTTLPPGGRADLTILLTAYCTGQAGPAFDRAGLFIARATFDTRRASGEPLGIRSFDGQVVSMAPTAVRLRRGFVPTPLGRPKLDPAP